MRARAQAAILTVMDHVFHGRCTAQQLVDELVRRGWALADLTPQAMGFEPDDIVQRPYRRVPDN